MCTEMDAQWSFLPGMDVDGFDFSKVNAKIKELLIGTLNKNHTQANKWLQKHILNHVCC